MLHQRHYEPGQELTQMKVINGALELKEPAFIHFRYGSTVTTHQEIHPRSGTSTIRFCLRLLDFLGNMFIGNIMFISCVHQI